ncbi:ferredoxin [Streptomyces axinellae]|jgi:ferredoxin|uniref:ferredoxin n=1 Tax=Streptomyces axinellae TaxID=552788 RepID=UPI0031D0BDEB
MRIKVDREKCTSSGSCAMYFPGLFDQDDKDGRVRLITEHPSGGQEAEAREAASRCPTGAISVLETSG